LFGEAVEGEVALSTFGKIVEGEWKISANIRREIELDEFVVMPNHIHGIVSIRDHHPVGATGR
jgi:REP element-mobilizing transposase RayT